MTAEEVIAQFAAATTEPALKGCFRDAAGAIDTFTHAEKSAVTAAFVAARDRIRNAP